MKKLTLLIVVVLLLIGCKKEHNITRSFCYWKSVDYGNSIDKYKAKGLVIVGFPANNFAGQEPGTNAEIASFCQKNYGVSFPMMSKISVKGADMAPIYHFLTEKSKNGLQDSEVQWNFQKYLINEKGQLEKVVSPQTLPTDAEIVNWINK